LAGDEWEPIIVVVAGPRKPVLPRRDLPGPRAEASLFPMRSSSARVATVSRIRALTRLAAVAGLATVAFACSGNAGDGSDDEPTGNNTEPGCEGRGDRIVLGMSKASADGALEVVLSDAAPVPPVQGENSWTVEVSQAGEPVLDEGETDSQVIANIYMAEHDHNIRKRGTMTAPGVFEFPGFPITMNGYWEITIQVASDAEPDDFEDAVFGFCVRN
jgi:hypothetical protein